MSDLISRRAVLKLLSAMPPEEAITKAMLIQSVQQMDAAQPKSYREGYQAGFKDAQPEQQWIPCSERLPEYGEAVLTVNKDEDYEINHVIDEDNGEWFFDDAIAWMPLPEPYKEK